MAEIAKNLINCKVGHALGTNGSYETATIWANESEVVKRCNFSSTPEEITLPPPSSSALGRRKMMAAFFIMGLWMIAV
jgi:hypothetical protein